jgi:SEFIR domain-containing protein
VNHVFISYRHESPEHAREVRLLGEHLRRAKIPVELDQFYLDENPGGPDEGWPKWCEDRANKSVCVLIIASPGWFAAYEKSGAHGTGLGAASEADLFRQGLWDEQGHNARIRLAFLHEMQADTVPPRLKAWQQFRPRASDTELDRLIDWLAHRLGLHNVESPTVRWPEPLPNFQPDIANRHHAEWPAIRDMLAGRTHRRILLFKAESGYGKSALLLASNAYADKLGIPIARLDFKANYTDVAAVLGQLYTDLGDHLPNFSRAGGDKMHLLIKDLRALRRPVLLVLDTYEKASGVFRDWVCQNLLPEIEHSLGVALIVAGQECPDPDDMRWRGLTHSLPLGPIKDPALWKPWIDLKYPKFRERSIDLVTLVMASGGVPKTFSDMCRTIADQAGSPNP